MIGKVRYDSPAYFGRRRAWDTFGILIRGTDDQSAHARAVFDHLSPLVGRHPGINTRRRWACFAPSTGNFPGKTRRYSHSIHGAQSSF